MEECVRQCFRIRSVGGGGGRCDFPISPTESEIEMLHQVPMAEHFYRFMNVTRRISGSHKTIFVMIIMNVKEFWWRQ